MKSSRAQTASVEKNALLSSKQVVSKSSKSVLVPGFFNEVSPMTLAWHNIRVIREKPTEFVILDNVHGRAVPNEVTALMGARWDFIQDSRFLYKDLILVELEKQRC